MAIYPQNTNRLALHALGASVVRSMPDGSLDADVIANAAQISAKSAELAAKRSKITQAESETQAVKTLPFIKQLRRMQRSEVVDLVQAAFPAGPQRDLIKQLALVAWVTTLNNDKDDD